MAIGRPKAAFPWVAVNSQQDQYIEPMYLPPDFTIRDPSRLGMGAVHRFIEWIQARQADTTVAHPFLLCGVQGEDGKVEAIAPGDYAGEDQHEQDVSRKAKKAGKARADSGKHRKNNPDPSVDAERGDNSGQVDIDNMLEISTAFNSPSSVPIKEHHRYIGDLWEYRPFRLCVDEVFRLGVGLLEIIKVAHTNQRTWKYTGKRGDVDNAYPTWAGWTSKSETVPFSVHSDPGTTAALVKYFDGKP